MKFDRHARIIMGFVLTAGWVIATVFYVNLMIGWSNFLLLVPNELGDFFAGFAAPLAFLWFVIGYFQQGEELRLQREELSLQRGEVHRLANEAERQANSIQANEMHARRDTFLRVAQMIIDEQNGLASRFQHSHGWNRQAQVAWEEFGHGNKNAVFQRGIDLIEYLDANNRIDEISINTLDPQTILMFFNNFEKLIVEADICDPDQLLRGQFENSPMGTLYAGLCFVNQREILFEVRPKPTGLDQIR